ncbi:MAG TPA: type II secretion system protein GspG [Campylobacterales bacterium]|nr:type II secretion system protein GspG [Campylobacterales bacterium]
MRKGFSLIEIMIVIIILGLLAGLVLPKLMGQADKAKKKIVCIQMNALKDALKNFKLDNGAYPTTEQGLNALVSNPDESRYKSYPSGGYLDGKTPVDPWKNPYIYIYDSGNIDFISLGADGAEGGDSENADIRFTSECQR